MKTVNCHMACSDLVDKMVATSLQNENIRKDRTLCIQRT
jgi:hypothetical protein